jgi:hypothetical protein
MDWTHVAQDMTLWHALVNQVSETSGSTEGGDSMTLEDEQSTFLQNVL